MKDGGHFSGTVVRKEKNSITLIGPDGTARTFLYTELAGPIQYGSPDTSDTTPASGASGGVPATQGQTADDRRPESKAVEVAAAFAHQGDISFPTGTEFPVRITGFLDSCCLPPGTMTLGTTDADLKGSNGKVVIPGGSNVIFDVVSSDKIEGRETMVFRLTSADFDGHHYLIDDGAQVTFAGAKEGSAAAKTQGLNVHLQDQTLMGFKAVKPVTFHLSQ